MVDRTVQVGKTYKTINGYANIKIVGMLGGTNVAIGESEDSARDMYSRRFYDPLGVQVDFNHNKSSVLQFVEGDNLNLYDVQFQEPVSFGPYWAKVAMGQKHEKGYWVVSIPYEASVEYGLLLDDGSSTMLHCDDNGKVLNFDCSINVTNLV